MQSQFSRDVLGVVRLDEARRNKAKEKEILFDISNDTEKDTMKSLKQEAKSEKQGYSQLKKLRWSLFINSDKLSDSKTEKLKSIKQYQHDLGVFFAIKTFCSSKRNTAPRLSCPCHLLNQHRQARRLQQQAQHLSRNESATVTA